jgi:hypothetical protein
MPPNAFQLACVWKNPALENRQTKSFSLAERRGGIAPAATLRHGIK